MEVLDFEGLGISADELFSDSTTPVETDPQETLETSTTEEQDPALESVGSEEDTQVTESTPSPKGQGSSPNFFSSIAEALREEGILSELDDDTVKGVTSAEDFASIIEKQIQSKFDLRQRRIHDALTYGIEPTSIQKYENALHYLASIKEEHLKDEGEQGATLRRELLIRDFMNRGYSQERAEREVEKSFKTGSDIQDAIDARDNIFEAYNSAYTDLIEEAKTEQLAKEEQLKKDHEILKNSFLEDSDFNKTIGLDKTARQKAYTSLAIPTVRLSDGTMVTEMQKAQMDNPVEYLKGVAMAYALTKGFKDFSGLTKSVVNKAVKSKLKELESTLTQTRFPEGGLDLVTKENDELDYLKKGIKLDL